MDLTDKVAFITGGAQGIGFEIAKAYASHGATLVICDVNEATLAQAVTDLERAGSQVMGIKLDVGDLHGCDQAAKKAVDNYKRIDILVNNAGITRDNLIFRMSEEDFDRVIRVNLKGVFNCIKIVSRIMLRQKQGRIINLASIAGIIGNVGQVNYAASKAGVIAITKSSAKELAVKNVTVNAIAPGFIKSEMTDVLPEEVKNRYMELIPLRRPGLPEDVANAAVFLASEYASYITGQVLVVDGGMVM
jgi:3-oxoacyl-[acyl-carrier protein] reductase